MKQGIQTRPWPLDSVSISSHMSCIRKSLTQALPVDFRRFSVLLYFKRMNGISMTSFSLSRHSISASLVPTNSPKRSGQLHQTQVGEMKLGQKHLCYSNKRLLHVLRLPVLLLPNLVNFSCSRSEMLNKVMSACRMWEFWQWTGERKAIRLAVSTWPDLFRAVTKLCGWLLKTKCSGIAYFHPALPMALLPC